MEYRLNKLTSSEYDETTWAARNYRTFVKQRISVAIHLAAAEHSGAEGSSFVNAVGMASS